MNAIVFIDTETTSLRPDRRIWEVGLIKRGPDGSRHEYQRFIDAADLDLGNADSKSLAIGRFYDRHPNGGGAVSGVDREAYALKRVEQLTRGAYLVGAVPNFDTEVLAMRMRANGICPSWHYHLVDFENLIVGFLRGRGEKVPELPWHSDELSRLVGVEPPGDDERHTALGDARWAMRVCDKVMGEDWTP